LSSQINPTAAGYDFLRGGGGGGGGSSPVPVTPPSPTTQSLPSGGSPSNKTFGSFTDPTTAIASYQAQVLNVVGTTATSGSGLGPYSVSGFTDGDFYVLYLNALDSGAVVIGTAIHAVAIASASTPDLTAPVTPSPVLLAAGSTALGSTVVGSWNEPVAVVASVTASDGSTPAAVVSGSGAGPYSVSVASGLNDGVVYAVFLQGSNGAGQVASVVLVFSVGAVVTADVTPPSPTTQSVASGGSPSNKTFSSFTDADGVIASYSASIANIVGSTIIASGSGLGPYSVSGFSDGDSYSIVLNALSGSGQPVAQAIHTVKISASNLTSPATPQPLTLAVGTTSLGSTLIGSWSSSVTVTGRVVPSDGPTPGLTISGSGAGPYSVSISSGLLEGVTYSIELAGTAADGQVAQVTLSVRVEVLGELLAPNPPTPVILPAGSTSLGSTTIGSWSASVNVSAYATGSQAEAPDVTLSGSSAGPYSVSIASGLSDGGSYIITLVGIDSAGQSATTVLGLTVESPPLSPLVAPPTPTPVILGVGSTSLPSTLIGSWGASVTVTTVVQASDGSLPVATVTGSGAGPYSVSVASDLSGGVTYAIILTGTDSGAQQASVTLVFTVREQTGWVLAQTYNFVDVDTGSVSTTSTGMVSYPLTKGGVPFLNLVLAQSPSGTITIQAVNGSGITYDGSGRSVTFPVNLASLGINNRQRWAIEIQATGIGWTATTTGTMFLFIGVGTSTSGSSYAEGLTWSTNYRFRARSWIGSGVVASTDQQSSPTVFPSFRALFVLINGLTATGYAVGSLGNALPETWGVAQGITFENVGTTSSNFSSTVNVGMACVSKVGQLTLRSVRVFKEVV